MVRSKEQKNLEKMSVILKISTKELANLESDKDLATILLAGILLNAVSFKTWQVCQNARKAFMWHTKLKRERIEENKVLKRKQTVCRMSIADVVPSHSSWKFELVLVKILLAASLCMIFPLFCFNIY